MGYRSDVAYAVVFDMDSEPEVAHAEYLHFKKWVMEQHEVTKEQTGREEDDALPCRYEEIIKSWYLQHNSDGMFKWYDADNALMFRASDVKWYENYPDVIWHETLLERIDAQNYRSVGWRFVRIGEQVDDTEIKENDNPLPMWEWVDVSRHIEFSPPSESLNKEAA